MIDLLLQKLEESDAAAAVQLVRDEIGKKEMPGRSISPYSPWRSGY